MSLNRHHRLIALFRCCYYQELERDRIGSPGSTNGVMVIVGYPACKVAADE